MFQVCSFLDENFGHFYTQTGVEMVFIFHRSKSRQDGYRSFDAVGAGLCSIVPELVELLPGLEHKPFCNWITKC